MTSRSRVLRSSSTQTCSIARRQEAGHERRLMHRRLLLAVIAAAMASIPATASDARVGHVLRVGTYRGIPGQFKSIQAAVNAAKPGDRILVGPGDYKTSSNSHPAGADDTPAGILIQTPNLWLRGMNRNKVIVDGTKPGTPPCSSDEAAQNFGPAGDSGPLGLNGIMIWKASNVSVENLTACNFLGGKGDAGNEIWWNGGDGSAKVGGHGYWGSYLNATTTFFNGEDTAAQYGICSSNWD